MNLIYSDLYFSIASALTSLIVLALFWIADTVDREPWKTILSSYIAGIGSYIISIGVYLSILRGVELLRYSMIAGWAVSFTVAIGIQIITCKIILYRNNRNIDTITDYILHFCSVGIGFETAEKIITSLAIQPWMQNTSRNLYDSVFLLGESNPLMFMILGIAAFFWRAKRKNNRKKLATISIISAITFVGSQLIFYSIPIVKNFTSPHIKSPLSDLTELMSQISESTSYVIIAVSLTFAVLFDLQIFNNFLTTMLNVLDENTDSEIIKKIESMRNPIALISSGNQTLWNIVKEDQEISCTREEYTYVARKALLHWTHRNEPSNIISESLTRLKRKD